MKKRSKYRPRRVLLNTMAFVQESLTPVAKHDNYLLDLKIVTSMAMASLMKGTATKRDMDVLVAMSNIVEALYELGFGRQYQDVATEGRYAILSIVYRAVERLRFVPTGEEVKRLNTLMELHDAQMDAITIVDMERAISLAKRRISSKDSVALPPVPEVLK
jgi:predicted type IV restriction endonuclease